MTIRRYFVGSDSRLVGECLTLHPKNPEKLEIIHHETLENPQEWVKVGESLIFSPIMSEVTIATLSAQIQKRLDDFAKTRRYDNVTSGTKYDDLTDAEISSMPSELQAIVTRYRAESRYLKLVTAQTWAKGEVLMSEVLAGTRPTPSSISDIESELPTLSWPV